MFTHAVIHYGEIGIKGKNRPFFERKLADNIRLALKGVKYQDLRRIPGRLLLTLSADSPLPEIEQKLQRVFGINYFSLAVNVSHDLAKIRAVALALVSEEKPKSIRVLTKRANKQFPLDSLALNKDIGQHLLNHLPVVVDLIDADLSLWLEIVNKYCLVYTKKVDGLKGLPVGVSGKVLCLLSGGINSPVAAWLMMKRGCTVDFVHFYNDAINSKESLRKIKDLASLLSSYQKTTTLYLVPFRDLQYALIKSARSEYRMLLYKRLMYRVAAAVAEKARAKALVSGDNIARVSSRVLPHLELIWKASSLILLSPVITYDKQEIVNLSQKIGAYEISTRQYGDCCSFMIAERPVLDARLPFIEKMEAGCDVKPLVKKALREVTVHSFDQKK